MFTKPRFHDEAVPVLFKIVENSIIKRVRLIFRRNNRKQLDTRAIFRDDWHNYRLVQDRWKY